MAGPVIAPDIEAAVAWWLRADSRVAGLVDTRVGTEAPERPTWPLVMITLPPGGSSIVDGWAYRATIDVHALAETKAEASLVARECQRSVVVMTGVVRDAVIPATRLVAGLRWLPDPSFVPAQPRYVFSVAVTFHPIP